MLNKGEIDMNLKENELFLNRKGQLSKAAKEEVDLANKVLEDIFSNLNELEMTIIQKTTPFEKKLSGIEKAIDTYVDIFKRYKDPKNRKRHSFKAMKDIKKKINDFHKEIVPSPTHLFHCISSETELIIAKYANTMPKLPTKMAAKLNIESKEDIKEIENEFRKLTGVVYDDFKDASMPSNKLIEQSKDLINRISGFNLKAIYHNDMLYNYENCQEAMEAALSKSKHIRFKEKVHPTLIRNAQYSNELKGRYYTLKNLLDTKEKRYPKKLRSQIKGILTRLLHLSEAIEKETIEANNKYYRESFGELREYIELSCELAKIDFTQSNEEEFISYYESLKSYSESRLVHELQWLRESTGKTTQLSKVA